MGNQRKVNNWQKDQEKLHWVKSRYNVGLSASDTSGVPAGASIFDKDEVVAGTLGNAGNILVQDTVDGFNHRTKIVLTGVTLDAIAGGAALALGEPMFVIPAGEAIIHNSYINVAIQQTEGNITADTPDVGLGTTLASGANATLDAAPAGSENIHTGQTAADCDGTATVNTLGTQLVIATADSHTVYLNVADTWAASGDAAATVSGEIVVNWSKVS